MDTTTAVRTDTVRIAVPVVTVHERLKRDTLVTYLQGETRIRYRYSTKTDSIFIEAKCPDKEIITVDKIRTIKVQILPKWFWFVVGGSILAFIALIFKK
jgi:hypothetical protein